MKRKGLLIGAALGLGLCGACRADSVPLTSHFIVVDKGQGCWAVQDILNNEIVGNGCEGSGDVANPAGGGGPPNIPNDVRFYENGMAAIKLLDDKVIVVTQGKNITTFAGPDAFCNSQAALLDVTKGGSVPITITFPADIAKKDCR